jgi:Flp pilus assembly protein TadG
MNRASGRDEGLATVEFALLAGVLFLLVAFAWPLGSAFFAKYQLERSMNDVVRYATAAPNTPAYDPNGAATSRRPTCDEVTHELYRSLGIANDPTAQSQLQIPTFTCPIALAPGQTFTITVNQTTDLGPLGSLLSVAGITHSSTVTVSAAASGREE